jgi:acetone carboxylase gamma subunit
VETQNGDKLDQIAFYSIRSLLRDSEKEIRDSMCPNCPQFKRVERCFPCFMAIVQMNAELEKMMKERFGMN